MAADGTFVVSYDSIEGPGDYMDVRGGEFLAEIQSDTPPSAYLAAATAMAGCSWQAVLRRAFELDYAAWRGVSAFV
jgi:hypothetical protein